MANQFNIININLFCNQSRFKYINKELACGDPFVVKKHAYKEFRGKVEDFIQQKIKEKEVIEVSIYFRDLENGPTLGINEHSQFVPASLLKLPVLLTYLVLAEANPELLEKTLKFHTLKELPTKQITLPSKSIQENTSYTINDLLEYAIVYSDNNAYLTLVQYINQTYPDQDPFGETFRDLGIIDPENTSSQTISVKSYASIFNQLYNSSFLKDKESSEKALGILARTDYNDGIVAGVPAGIKVAHKFGERLFTEGLKQLHDCGVVYYPDNPYLLCIMTRGQDFDKLPSIISEISRMVYEEFESRKL